MGIGGASSMTLLEDYTFQFGDSGVILNTDDVTTPFVDVVKVTGLDMPEFRTNERTREGMHGGSLDIDFLNMRTIIIDATVYGTAQNIQSYLDALKANFALSNISSPLYFYAPGKAERIIFCKSLGIKFDWTTALRTGQSPLQIQLKAEDPIIYEKDIQVLSTGLVTGGSGYAFNKGFPYGYGAISGSNSVNASNPGNIEVGATLRFENVSSPSVVSDTEGGRTLTLDTNVGDGEYYDLDLRNRTVLLNGVANRRNLLANASRWFMLNPGDNQLRFLGSNFGSGTAKMTIIYRPGSY